MLAVFFIFAKGIKLSRSGSRYTGLSRMLAYAQRATRQLTATKQKYYPKALRCRHQGTLLNGESIDEIAAKPMKIIRLKIDVLRYNFPAIK